MSSVAKLKQPARAPECAVPSFDLRPQRDVCAQRLRRERMRRMIRVLALVGGEMVAASVALLAVDLAAGRAGLASWTLLFPLYYTLVVGGQAALGTYGSNRARRDPGRTTMGALLAVGVLVLLGDAYPQFRLPATDYLLLAALSAVLFMGVRLVIDRAIRAIYRRGIGRKPTLIIGEHEAAWEILVHLIASEERRVEVVGHLAPDPSRDPTALGGLDRLGELIEAHDIRSVIVSAQIEAERFQGVVRECLLHGTSVSIVPGTLAELPCRFSSQEFMGWPLMVLQVPRLHLLQMVLKRTVDVVGALAGLLLLAPLFAVLAVLIKRDSPGPVFFRQERLGLGGDKFCIFKFRSMRADAEERLRADPLLYRRYQENGFKLAPEEDPRLTRLGAFLRRTSLDEMPQLLNVLLGHMSLVGPRPIVTAEIANYGSERERRVFLAVKPGLTGHWQVNGRSDVGYPERAQLDIQYIKTWSLLKDLKILARTVPVLVRRQGAF